jgi:hypothetical protein
MKPAGDARKAARRDRERSEAIQKLRVISWIASRRLRWPVSGAAAGPDSGPPAAGGNLLGLCRRFNFRELRR